MVQSESEALELSPNLKEGALKVLFFAEKVPPVVPLLKSHPLNVLLRSFTCPAGCTHMPLQTACVNNVPNVLLFISRSVISGLPPWRWNIPCCTLPPESIKTKPP